METSSAKQHSLCMFIAVSHSLKRDECCVKKSRPDLAYLVPQVVGYNKKKIQLSEHAQHLSSAVFT